MLKALKAIGLTTLWLLLIFVVLACLYGFYRTWKTGKSPHHEAFLRGTIPLQTPTGQWNGYVDELPYVSWKGKKFLDDGKGINVFVRDDVKSEAYPFAFSVTESIKEKGKSVVTLDYNQKENPLWLRFIADEMVSVGENKFLGIVYIKFIPGIPFRMGYFRLEK